MSKVKLTREQAEAIKEFSTYGQEALISTHAKYPNKWIGDMQAINGMPLLKLVDALRIGYEVEPEYKEGDWVITEGYSDDYDGKALEIRRIDEEKGGTFVYFNNPKTSRDNFLITRIKRHATKEEIWWAKHGRKPWELRRNDLVSSKSGCSYTINLIKKDYVEFLEFGMSEKVEKIKESFKVICFAEDRKDVQA